MDTQFDSKEIYKSFCDKYISDLNEGDSIRKKQSYKEEVNKLNKLLLEEDLKEYYRIHVGHFKRLLGNGKSGENIKEETKRVTSYFLDIVDYNTIGERTVTSLSFPDKIFDEIESLLKCHYGGESSMHQEVMIGFSGWKNYLKDAYIKTLKLAALRYSISDLREIESMSSAPKNSRVMAPSENKQWVIKKWSELRPNYPELSGDSECAREVKDVYERTFPNSTISEIQIKRYNKPEYK